MASDSPQPAAVQPGAPAFVRPLHEIDSDDVTHVGGKAANLGHLMHAGIPVPAGFCITTSAFAAFVAEDERYVELVAALRRSYGAELVRATQDVQIHLAAQPMPLALRDAIQAAWTTVGRPHRYAVRSSATLEDGGTASFAGQLYTALNIIGFDALVQHTIRCWSSWFGLRAVAYRRAQNVDSAEVGMAVVVQRMVMADRSGVMFTAHPMTGHRHTSAINAIYGLGEAFVSGRSDADSYEIDQRTRELTGISVAVKHKATRARREGGLYEVEVSPERRESRVLNDQEVGQLVDLGLTIDKLDGAPQDIEWCFEGKKVFVVQARPITTLYPLPAPAPDDPHQHAHLCVNHLQVMTDAMPPLSCSAWAYALPFGKGRRRQRPSPWVRVAGGRVYLDVSKPLRSPPLRPAVLRLLTHVDTLTAKALSEVSARPGFARGPRVRPWSLLPFAVPAALRVAMILLWRDPIRVADRATRLVHDLVEQLDSLAHADPGRHLSRVRDRLSTLIFRLVALPPVVLSGVLAGRLLRRLIHGSEQDFAALARGLLGNLTTEMDLELGDVADIVHADATLSAAFRDIDKSPAQLQATVDTTTNIRFSGAWHHFLSKYGARAASEIDPSRPRWREDPLLLLRIIAGTLGRTAPGWHRKHHAELVARAEHTTDHMLAQAARATWGRLRRRIVDRLIRVHRNLLAVREHPKWVLVHAFDQLRRATLAVAHVMHDREQIAAVDDVWFLELDELLDAYNHPRRRVRGKIERRRRDHEHHRRLPPPRVLTGEGENPRVRHGDDDQTPGTLRGTAVSHGDVVGRARVILDPSRETLHPGEILVAPFSDPGWTPLFLNAGGLVMEVGGMMTHGSVIAREYGIPAVVCVPEATRIIRTGQRLRVDGERGVVVIMDDGVVAGDADPVTAPVD